MYGTSGPATGTPVAYVFLHEKVAKRDAVTCCTTATVCITNCRDDVICPMMTSYGYDVIVNIGAQDSCHN